MSLKRRGDAGTGQQVIPVSSRSPVPTSWRLVLGLVVLMALLAGLLFGAWTATDLSASSSGTPPLVTTPRAPAPQETCPDTADSPPPNPTDLRCLSVSPTEIALCWRDYSCTEAGFSIERSLDGINWAEIASTARNIDSYRDTGLTPNTTYYYRVRAFRLNTGEFSHYTNVTMCTTTGLSLLTPPNHSLICDLPPVFSWQPVSGAITYTLQVGADPAFTQSLAIDVIVTSTTAYTPSTALAGGIYYWRVRAENDCAASEWSDVWDFRIGQLVQPPSPLSPPNGSTTCDDRPTFSWTAIPGALSYEIEIDGLIYPTSGTSFKPGFNLGTGRHCWRVRAIGECGPSPWSEEWCLTVQAPPPVPEVTAPPDNANVCTPLPTFEWTPSFGADYCCFQLDDDPAFGSPLIDACGVGPSFMPSINIPPGTYYWRVRCVNECGPSNWTPSRKLTIGVPPGAPTPTAPLTDEIVCDTTPTLEWSEVPGATSYRVQLTGSTCDFSTPTIDETVVATSLTITTPLNPGLYCWRVQAINECGPGPWSTSQRFTVRIPPVPPDLSSPPNTSQTCDTSPTLSWSPVATAFSYELQIDDASCDFAPSIVDVTVPDTSYDVTPALAPGTYCWRVRAINECGPGEWSGTWKFTVRAVPPTPTLVSPPDGIETCDLSLTLCWVAVTGAKSYDLELDDTVYTGLTGPCFTTPELTTGSHTWRVRAVNECGRSDWSATHRFTIQSEVPICQELICNGGFETDECWIDPLACQPRPSTFMAHTGARSMLIGVPTTAPDTCCNSAVWQAITIPPDATQVTLSFYYWPFTQDTIAKDWQEVQIRDVNLNVLETLMRVAENNASNDPWRFKSFDLTGYAGRTIVVYFSVHNNGVGNRRTFMYLDDVSVQACHTECPTGQGAVSGRVALQGRNSDYSGIIVSADGLPCAITGPDGQFNCNLPAGAHTLTATECKYLVAALPGVTVADGNSVTVRDALLAGGDTNNDTQVSLFDLVAVGGAFGTCPGGDGCPGPDINGDGCTNIFDLVILGGNYGLNGPTGWARPSALAARPMAPARLELVADGDRWLVRLRDATEVYGVQLRLQYDPARLHIRDADGDPSNGLQVALPGLDATGSYVVQNTVDPDSGEVRIAFTLLNPAPALSGDVVLAEISTEATGGPTTDALSVVDALLGDRDGQQLPVNWGSIARRDYRLYLPLVQR
jgi:hypothetical protein